MQHCIKGHKRKEMSRKLWGIFLLGLLFLLKAPGVSAQIKIEAEVFFTASTHTLTVRETVSYRNVSADTLKYLYFNDWLNAFRSKTSSLGQHFASQYIKRFHFSKLSERGLTKIDFIRDHQGKLMTWERPEKHLDILKVKLKEKLLPGETVKLQLQYMVRIPEDKFTGYGRDKNGNYNLRYWLVAPAVYREGWKIYSNKDLNDQFRPKLQVKILFRLPVDYHLYSGLKQKQISENLAYKKVRLTGKNQANVKLSLTKVNVFDKFHFSNITVVSNIVDEGVPDKNKAVTIWRIVSFLKEQLGAYPHQKILVTQADYKSSPIYGLNQLPSFIRPFPDGFQYDIKMMKTITRHYLRNTLLINPRKEAWLINAVEIKLLMDYVEQYYPNTKLIGKLSEVIGIRWSHLADLAFNDQYQFYFMNMNRANLDQALSLSKDSLIRFNAEIANPYKAGVGFKYLDDFLGDSTLSKTIAQFYRQYKLKPVQAEDFAELLKHRAHKEVDWFFEQYVKTNVRLDFNIKNVERKGDSLQVVIENKEKNSMPVSLYTLRDRAVLSKYWIEDTQGMTTISIPAKGVERLALNYQGIIPEVNKRNNYKGLRKLFNKPIQLRLLTDVEDPFYSQFFLMPEFTYNLYDGFTMGPKISNEAILPKPFSYSITPEYGFRSQTLIGSLSLLQTFQFRNKNLSRISLGLSGNRYSYDKGLFYYRFSPYIVFAFRHRDLRNRERQYITLRSVTVHRENGENLNLAEEPNYSVFDAQYTYSDQGLVSSLGATFDFQVAKKFSKLSLTAKYRKLFLSNRQIEFRIYAGAFLYNHTAGNSNYFSFALDRPTDYLFDYNYYGRSESSGLFSQQFIEAEGGFKSRLQPAFANQWITTLNANISLLGDWLYAYGDVGLVKNQGSSAQFLYDSGLRLSLVQDYFELFFPVYSSLGWEVNRAHYNRRIRFIVTLDLNTLIGLFKRTYY